MAAFGCPQIFNTDQGAQSTDHQLLDPAQGPWHRDQHGRSGFPARQCLRRAVLALDQVRGGLSSRIPERDRSQALNRTLHRVLQPGPAALGARRQHTGPRILQSADRAGGISGEVSQNEGQSVSRKTGATSARRGRRYGACSSRRSFPGPKRLPPARRREKPDPRRVVLGCGVVLAPILSPARGFGRRLNF
ncbi:MAG: hypothetical protein JWM87_3536 [Candidatus Eremiobacteraeota bacterium]|nr:hypothetical protein [Candidatus Eremiobacteraeota bacterium]